MVFDLEKARKIVDAMSPTPWIVLEDRYGQIDVIRNPDHPMHEEGVIELWGRTSETATPDAIGISYMRSEFPNALDEIGRLQLELTQALKDLSSKDEIIKKLKKEVKQFKSELKTEQGFTNSYIKRLHDAEAKIEKLEEVKE